MHRVIVNKKVVLAGKNGGVWMISLFMKRIKSCSVCHDKDITKCPSLNPYFYK